MCWGKLDWDSDLKRSGTSKPLRIEGLSLAWYLRREKNGWMIRYEDRERDFLFLAFVT